MKIEGQYWHRDSNQYRMLISEFTNRTIFINMHSDKFFITPKFQAFDDTQIAIFFKEFTSVPLSDTEPMRILAESVLSAPTVERFQVEFDKFISLTNSFVHKKKNAVYNLLIILYREGRIGFPLNRRKWVNDLYITQNKIENILAKDLVNKCGRNNIKETIKGGRRGNSYSNLLYTPLSTICGIECIGDLSPNILNHEYIMDTLEGRPTSKSALISLNASLNRLYEYLVLTIKHEFPEANIAIGSYNPEKRNIDTIDPFVEYFNALYAEFPLMQQWIDLGTSWFKKLNRTKTLDKTVLRIVITTLNKYQIYHTPKNYFLTQHTNRPVPSTTGRNLLILQQFLNYVYEKTCVQEDAQHGKVWEQGYTKVDLGAKANAYNHASTVKDKIPQKFLNIMHEVLTEDDFAWPKTFLEDYFEWINPITNNVEQVWYPGRAMAILLMFHLPLRTHQIVHLTSGIEDSFKLSIEISDTQDWYSWADSGLRGKNGEFVQRGVIRPYEATPGKYTPVFYISTNKSQDRNKKSIDKGYILPYTQREAFEIICKFVSWSDKYIKSKTPIPYKQINYYRHNYSQNELELMGEDNFLWLDPCRGGILKGKNLYSLWHKLMKEVENRWNSNAPINDQLQIVFKEKQHRREKPDVEKNTFDSGKIVPTKSQVKTLRWTLHCMRVTGITWMMDHGVSLDIVRAIAGHASEYMTMYYIVRNPLEVEGKISEAHDLAKINASDECITYLKANFDKPENLVSRIFSNSQDCFRNLGDRTLLTDVGTGLCLVGGSGCDLGYEVLVESGKSIKTDYLPVPGGKESCELCRFFVSYSSYLEKLKIRWNYLYWISRENYKHLKELLDNIHNLSIEKEEARKKGEMFSRSNLMDAYQRKADATEEKTKTLMLLLQKITLIIRKYQNNPDELTDSSSQHVLYGNPDGIKMVVEMCHPFVALHNIVADSISEPFVNPTDEVPYFKLAQMLDQMFEKSGLPSFVYQPHGPSREQQLVDHCNRLRGMIPADYFDKLFDPNNFDVTLRTLGLVNNVTNCIASRPIQALAGQSRPNQNANIMEWDLTTSRERQHILNSVIAEEEDGEDEDTE